MTVDTNVIDIKEQGGKFIIADMTIPCQSVTTVSAANIFPIDFTITSINCTTGKCSVDVNVTYTNSGDVAGPFVPNITIDGIGYDLPSDTLGSLQYVLKTFPITGLKPGYHTICSGSICRSVNIVHPVSMGFGTLLGLGFLFGFLYSRKKKKEEIPIPKRAKPLSEEYKFLIAKLREKGAIGEPICTDGVCKIGKWIAVAESKGKEPIIIHDP